MEASLKDGRKGVQSDLPNVGDIPEAGSSCSMYAAAASRVATWNPVLPDQSPVLWNSFRYSREETSCSGCATMMAAIVVLSRSSADTACWLSSLSLQNDLPQRVTCTLNPAIEWAQICLAQFVIRMSRLLICLQGMQESPQVDNMLHRVSEYNAAQHDQAGGHSGIMQMTAIQRSLTRLSLPAESARH